MGAIENIHVYEPSVDICVIVLCVAMRFLMKSSYAIKRKNHELFIHSVFCLFLACALRITYHTISVKTGLFAVVCVYLLHTLVYILLMLELLMFVLYLKKLIGLSKEKGKLCRHGLIVFFFIFSIMQIVEPFFGIGIKVHSYSGISEIYYIDTFTIAYVFYMCIIAGLLLKFRKRFVTKIYKAIWIIYGMSLLIIAIQWVNGVITYTTITFVIPLLALMYMFHYNSYDAQTGTLDAKSFDSYIRDMEVKSFSLIFVYLENLRVSILDQMAEAFFHFNEKYFEESVTFRLRDEKLCVVYKNDKQEEAFKNLPKMLDEFEELYQEYRLDYKIILMDDVPEIVCGDEYLNFEEYIERKIPNNYVYQCNQRDVDEYKRDTYILSELHDIYSKGNLDDERVLIYAQPVLNMQTGKFDTAEALVRFEFPGIGIVNSSLCIPVAEEHNYIHEISLIILNKTCKCIKELKEKGCELERVSVNFCISELHNYNFADEIAGIIRKNGIEYSKIAIELTESSEETDFEAIRTAMDKLQQLGVKFYLDDFGTSYSNFERIIGLPVDIIKFDRSMTILSSKNAESRLIVGTMANLFRETNYNILFEGVEDEEDEIRCREMRANYLQGFRYSQPFPMEELYTFINNN